MVDVTGGAPVILRRGGVSRESIAEVMGAPIEVASGHADRPAMIYVISGEVTEYASNCAVPIVHKAGDVAPETHVTAHWWKNTGTKTVVLISVDILHDKMEEHMM